MSDWSKVNELVSREAGKAGLRGKINAKCISCTYDPYSGLGNWKQQVSGCTVTACPLYEIRPQSRGEMK